MYSGTVPEKTVLTFQEVSTYLKSAKYRQTNYTVKEAIQQPQHNTNML